MILNIVNIFQNVAIQGIPDVKLSGVSYFFMVYCSNTLYVRNAIFIGFTMCSCIEMVYDFIVKSTVLMVFDLEFV